MQRAALEADIARLTERKRALAAGIAALRGVEQDLLSKFQGPVSDGLPPALGLLRWSAKRRSSWAPTCDAAAAAAAGVNFAPVAIDPPSRDETAGLVSSAAAAALPPPLASGAPRRRSVDTHGAGAPVSGAGGALRGVLYQLLDLDASSREHSQVLFTTNSRDGAAAGSFAAAVAAAGPPAPAARDSPAPVPATPTATAEVAPATPFAAPRGGRAAAVGCRASLDSESGALSATAAAPAAEPEDQTGAAAAAAAAARPLRAGRRRRRHAVDPAAFAALLRHHAVCSGDSGRVAAPALLDAGGAAAASPHGTSWGMGLIVLADL